MALYIDPGRSFLRDVIGGYMNRLGEVNDKVTVVNAGTRGTCRNASFGEKYPERFFNVGIAEQNMVSFAAGLAHEGFIPYAFAMGPFLTMRACEQCRTDVAYGNLKVRMIGAYAGVSGGISGATHWSLEDCAIMRGIPGMSVIEPSDAFQAKQIMDFTIDRPGPIYIRTSVEAVDDIYDDGYKFVFGKASFPLQGDDGAFVCSGVVVQYAVKAAKRIKEKYGRNISVVDMHTIKPLDSEAVEKAASTGRVVIAQDHNIVGGLADGVTSCIACLKMTPDIKVLGVPDRFDAMAHAPFLYAKYGYDEDGLFAAMSELIEK